MTEFEVQIKSDLKNEIQNLDEIIEPRSVDEIIKALLSGGWNSAVTLIELFDKFIEQFSKNEQQKKAIEQFQYTFLGFAMSLPEGWRGTLEEVQKERASLSAA